LRIVDSHKFFFMLAEIIIACQPGGKNRYLARLPQDWLSP
jgi:hypothetical protein